MCEDPQGLNIDKDTQAGVKLFKTTRQNLLILLNRFTALFLSWYLHFHQAWGQMHLLSKAVGLSDIRVQFG